MTCTTCVIVHMDVSLTGALHRVGIPPRLRPTHSTGKRRRQRGVLPDWVFGVLSARRDCNQTIQDHGQLRQRQQSHLDAGSYVSRVHPCGGMMLIMAKPLSSVVCCGNWSFV